jgi:hypothetical protein
MSDQFEWDNSIKTLYQIPVAIFEIRFLATMNLQIEGMEPAFRGRLGLKLKQSWCLYDDFRHAACPACHLLDHCHYVNLFTPDVRDSEIANQKRKQLRPFVFKIEGNHGSEKVLRGESGSIEFCMFGPGIHLIPYFAKSACEAIETFPMKVTAISSLAPNFPESQGRSDFTSEIPLAWKLDDFLEPKFSSENFLSAHFVTPVHILTNGKALNKEDFSFKHLMLAIIYRLRDLKRSYGNDTDMGKIPADFSEITRQVGIVQNRLYWSRKKRFSKRQGQDIWLNGLKGDICFQGPFHHFSRMLKAAEIVRVGKGASEGNGWIFFQGCEHYGG